LQANLDDSVEHDAKPVRSPANAKQPLFLEPQEENHTVLMQWTQL
jgi:hypothetical protein